MNEGYCESCKRMEPLDEKGLIASHLVSYQEFGRWHRVTCKGTGLEPTEPEEAA